MRLGTPFHDDEGERDGQNRAAERGAEAPVIGDAFGAVVSIILEIDIAAARAPDRAHAVAVLVGADDLRQVDVGEPASVADFEETQDEDFPAVAAGEGLPALEECTDWRAEELSPAASFLVREMAIEAGETAGDDVFFGDYTFGYQPPD